MRLAWCIGSLAALLFACLDVRAGGTDGGCAARTAGSPALPVAWVQMNDDHDAVDRWCRAVGAPIVATPSGRAARSVPSLADLVVVTWNAHLGEGRLADLIDALREGRLTDGVKVERFVLLVQELFRRGSGVPAAQDGMRSAFAIKARRADAPDATTYAGTLGLSFLYVPSMRNGLEVPEDRGNAIVSTEPFTSAIAIELPLERQRRVALGVTIDVATKAGVLPLLIVDAHLEPLSSPKTLWVFRNPRASQMSAILRAATVRALDDTSPLAGIAIGGDLNTIQGGDDEPVYALLRSWSRELASEDRRPTHRMGRLDYLFFRSDAGWTLSTTRADDKFGSDHHPVVGRFSAHRRSPGG